MYRENDGGNRSAQLTLDSLKLQTGGDGATPRAHEETRLYHVEVAEGEPEFESSSIPHRFTFRDVLQANLDGSGGKDHSMIVVKKGTKDTYLNYHTTDTKNKKLSRLIKENRKAKWYAHRV
ncbi:amidase domain-containing protein [Streptomyces sp. E11-3]|uniref:amidase domain-containing protein n=1 Tax=Streptomyces sp. E11-3 TaxID=3110112 RepID=UPI00397F5B64